MSPTSPCDSGWEAHLAEKLEHLGPIRCYVKNEGLGFSLPHTIHGRKRAYIPDFIARSTMVAATTIR